MDPLSELVNMFLDEVWRTALQEPLENIPLSVWVWQLSVGVLFGAAAEWAQEHTYHHLGYELSAAQMAEIIGLVCVSFLVIHTVKGAPISTNLITSTLTLFGLAIITFHFLNRYRSKRQQP